jgi:hypothetical protein
MADLGGPEKLPKGKELEAAMLCVNGREFIYRLDWVRKELPEDSNAWKFLTGLAYSNPSRFIKLVEETRLDSAEWFEVDQILKSHPHPKIAAIKAYRETHAGVGLKEAKEKVEKRMSDFGISG